MKKIILTTALITGIVASSAAFAETTITKTSDGTTTTTITRSTDTDPRAVKIVTPEQFSTYAYSRWDKNADGFITPDEWDYNVAQWYGPKTTVIRTYNDWDLNHNGQLDNAEFDAVVKATGLYKTWSVTTVTTPTTVSTTNPSDSFDANDLNGDGKIVPSEWSQTHGKPSIR